jgi:hypothetical protein
MEIEMSKSPRKLEGLPVFDATKRIVVEISRQDITSGKSKDPSGCAAAKACLRQVPKCTGVRVFKSRTFLKMGAKWFRFHTPLGMRTEIVAFDRGAHFLPGVYVLQPLQPSKKATGTAHGTYPKKKPDGGRGKKRGVYHVIEGVREFGPTK